MNNAPPRQPDAPPGTSPPGVGDETLKADTLSREDDHIEDNASELETRVLVEFPTQQAEEPEYRPVGKRAFGRYELLIEMASGGMATLFLARIQGPQNFEKLVAIKKIHDHLVKEKAFVNMFLDEARISALIHHPNVAAIFDLGQIDQSYFIAMEYVHGQNLTDTIKAAIRRPGVFGWDHAARIVADAAAGLHAAHELKRKDGTTLDVVHRDVSPHNILLSYDGHVKVVDFGIVFAAERMSQTQAGIIKGKVGYMSPEQTRNAAVDRRADIFCLGIVLYEMTTLRRLFRGANEVATIMAVRAADVLRPRSANPDIPTELERIILRALERDPDRRFASAEQLAEQLDGFLVSHRKVVNRSKLAGLMDELFYDRRRLKDEQIRRAMDEPTTDPVRGVGMGPSMDDSLIAPQVVEKGRLRWLSSMLGGIVAVLAVVLVLVFALRREDRRDGTEPATSFMAAGGAGEPGNRLTAMGRTHPRPRSGNVSIRVDITPPVKAASVVFRGKTYSGPRFEVVVARSSRPEKLRIRAPGYQENTLVIVPVADSRVNVDLKKPGSAPKTMRTGRRPRARPRRPPRRPPRRFQPRPRRPMGGLRDFPD